MSPKFGELIGTALQIWRANLESSPNLESSLGTALQIETLKLISWSQSGLDQESVNSQSRVSELFL